jgi:hypothetical protein
VAAARWPCAASARPTSLVLMEQFTMAGMLLALARVSGRPCRRGV